MAKKVRWQHRLAEECVCRVSELNGCVRHKNMANSEQSRYNGKFCKKKIVKWRENLIESNKKRNKTKKEKIKGCRIIDTESFAKDMWCHSCKVPLSLRDTQKEIKNAVSSIITVKCWSCSALFEISTSPMEQSTTTKPTYNINSRLVIGTIESGIGLTHLNKILSAADPPIFHPSTYKRYEKKVGVAIESLARTSCRENIMIERELTIEKEGLKNASDWSPNSIVKLTISYDAGWQKRGSGRYYNSLTGHGTAIGFYSGKVIGYTTRNKRCTSCEHMQRHEENNNAVTETKNKHDCRMNFEGSSKAMEADMAREIFINNPIFIETNVRLGTLIGDDDLSNDKENGRVSSAMITKIAAAGITLDHLFQVYKSSGEKGINILLAQDVGGKPRVSKNKKVISDLCKRISILYGK